MDEVVWILKVQRLRGKDQRIDHVEKYTPLAYTSTPYFRRDQDQNFRKGKTNDGRCPYSVTANVPKTMRILARPTAISVPSGPFVEGAPILLVASSVFPARGSIIIVPCRPFIILPPRGWRPGAAIVVIGATRRWRPRPVAAVRCTIIPGVVAVIPISIITRSVFTRTLIAVLAAVIVWATTRIIQGDTNRPSTKVLAVQVLDGTIGVITAKILENAVTREVTINIRERDAAGLPSEIFQVLKATNDTSGGRFHSVGRWEQLSQIEWAQTEGHPSKKKRRSGTDAKRANQTLGQKDRE